MTFHTESTRTTLIEALNNNENYAEPKKKKEKRSIEEHFEQLEQTIFVEGLTSEVSTSSQWSNNYNSSFAEKSQ